MKVEIWSDIMCPFCYIGKRKFENALAQFEHKGEVEVVWKSFQLNPDMETNPRKNVIEYLAEIKGWTIAQSEQMHERVTKMASEVGLAYHFEKAVIANSLDAHRLIQFAKTKGKGDEAEERLFKAYFTEGKNTSDQQVLTNLAAEIGLNVSEVKKLYLDTDYTAEVKKDIKEAEQLGVTGVPFFVFDRKHAVSGAQPSEVFLEVLNKAFAK